MIADLLDLDGPEAARQALGTLVYDDPETSTVVRATEYLSGNIRHKLQMAQEAAADVPAYAVNVAALQEVIPRDLEPAEIESTLGAAWVSALYVQQFLREVLEDDDIEVSNLGARWSVKGGDRHSMLAETTWGTKARPAQALASNLLNNQEILITHKLPPDGPTVTDTEATAFAQAKALQLDERFRLWLWEDPDRAAHLQRYYNDRYNARVIPTYDRERIAAPGLSKAFTLNPHQHAAVARLRSTNTGVGLFHGTGAGKTLEMIVGGMELVRLGLIKKPVYAVPKGVLGQFQREFLQAYPRARILVADSSDLTGQRRHRFVAKWSTGNWDAVVISHTAFKKIPMSKAARLDYINQQIKRLEAHLDHAEGGDRYTVKDIENQIGSLKEKLEEELQTPGDSGVEFERTGSTFIFIDEFQVYKNLQVISSVQELALTGNQITADMDMKLSYLRSTYGERVVCAATATPVDNSPMEILSAAKYLAPSLLAEQGIVEDDQFVSTYIQPIHKVEMSVDGGSFKTRARYARYVNQPELKLLIGSFADVKLKRDLPLIEPAIIGGEMRLLTVDASSELREVMSDLGDRMKAIKAGAPRIKTKRNGEEAEDNSLWISTDGRLASLDVRLVGMETDQPQKLDVIADEIFALWQKHRYDVYYDEHGNEEPIKGSNIAVFCDLGVPGPDKEFDVYNGLAAKLTARGMPRSQIEFAQDAKNQQQKVRQNQAINDGRIAVIMGGRTGLGTGRNIQRRGIAIVQVDPTWKATPIIQSLGRHKRQGNQNTAIHHIAAVTLDSYDPFLWQKVATKQSYADAVLDFRDTSRIFEASEDDDNVIPAGVIFAVAANKPELEQMERVEAQLARLRLQQRMWNDEQFTYQITGEQGRRRIAELTERMRQAERAMERRTSTQGDAFHMRVAAATYNERREAGDALLQRLARFERTALDRNRQHVTELGELGGFGLQATMDWGFGGRYLALAFPDAPIDAVTLDPRDLKQQDPVGLIRRLENTLSSLEAVTERSVKHVRRLEANMARARDRAGQAFAQQAELEQAERQYRKLQMALGAVTPTAGEEEAATQTDVPDEDLEPEREAENLAEQAALADARPPRPEVEHAQPESSAPPAPETHEAADPAVSPGGGVARPPTPSSLPVQQAPPAPAPEAPTPGSSLARAEPVPDMHEGADEDTAWAKAPVPPIPQPPDNRPSPQAPQTNATAADTSAPESSSARETDAPSPFRTHDDITAAFARMNAPLRAWTATGLRDDLFIRGSHTKSHQHATAIEDLFRPGRTGQPKLPELRAALAAADAILSEIEDRPGVDYSGRAKPALTDLREQLQTLLARAAQTRAELRSLSSASTKASLPEVIPGTPGAGFPQAPAEAIAVERAQEVAAELPVPEGPQPATQITASDATPTPFRPEPFPNQREWTRGLHRVEAAEITLTSASRQVWDLSAVPAAFARLRHKLYAAIAAHEDRNFHDAEASLAESLTEAERLLKTLKGRDRTIMQEPLRAFSDLAKDFLGRHRATLERREMEDGAAHRIEAESRADMEEFIREWAANNQELIAARDRGDEETFRALANAAGAEEASAPASDPELVPESAPVAAPQPARGTPGQPEDVQAYPQPEETWEFGDDRAKPFGTTEVDTPQSSADRLHHSYAQWTLEYGQDIAEDLQPALSAFHSEWAAAKAVPADDWAGQLMAYTQAKRATLRLAAHDLGGYRAAPRLRHLARTAATHTERLALTAPDLSQAWIESLAAGWPRFHAPQEIAEALEAMERAAGRTHDADGTAKADPQLNPALLATARTPQTAAAHLAAMHNLAQAAQPKSGTLATYVGRLAATLQADPELAETACTTGPRPVAVPYRDLAPAPPYATAAGAQDHKALQSAHESVASWAKQVATATRPNRSAAERQLAQLTQTIQRLPLGPSAGQIDAAWPHLLAAVADLARQVSKEWDDEGRSPNTRQDLPALGISAMRLARRLHSHLIEYDGRLDDELAALTAEALADRQLREALGTPASPLTGYAGVPFAPAMVDWVRERAGAMSPLLRHALAADATGNGWIGVFGRLAHTVTEQATGQSPTRQGGRLPVPTLWEQHAAEVDELLDHAASDERLTGWLVANDPDEIRNTIRERVDELVSRMVEDRTDSPFSQAYFDGSSATRDVLVAHVTAQTAQTARLAMLPEPEALYAVRRGAELVVCRGADLAHLLGEGYTLRLSANRLDGWTIGTHERKRVGTVGALADQDQALRFTAAAGHLAPNTARALLHDNPDDWPGLLQLDEPLQTALIDHAATAPAPASSQAAAEPSATRAVDVGAPDAGEWLVDLPAPTPYAPGTVEDTDAAATLVADIQAWLGQNGPVTRSIDAWSANAAAEAWTAAATPSDAQDHDGWQHWLTMASAHLHLEELHTQWSSSPLTRLEPARIAELRVLLRRSDNYLARAAQRPVAAPSPTAQGAEDRPAAPYASVEEAVQEDARLKQWWQELVADRVGPVSIAFDHDTAPFPRIQALLGDRWHDSDPARCLAALTHASQLAMERAAIREETDPAIAPARIPDWYTVAHALTHHTQRWAATLATTPETAQKAARHLHALRVNADTIEPGMPPTSPNDMARAYTGFLDSARELAATDLLRSAERSSERLLHHLLTLVTGEYTEPQDRPELPALLNHISRIAGEVATEQADEARRHPQLENLRRLGTSAASRARTLQSALDQAHPDVERELAALTEQALADQALMSTVHYTSSEAGVLPYAPALWLWLQDREDTMSPRLKRVLDSNATPVALVGAFGTLWERLLEAAPSTGTAPEPLPDAGTPVPDAWAQWPDEIAALAVAASSDIDLRLRLAPGRPENQDEVVALWTEHHAERHAQDSWPATMLAQYFDANAAPSDMLHTYLRTELVARLAAAKASTPTDAVVGAALPAAAIRAWHLDNPQGMGESEDAYPDQAAARDGALKLAAALGNWTRAWSGDQYRAEKSIKEIADRAAAALWADALTGPIGTHPDAAQLTVQIADLASEFLVQLEDDSRNHPAAYRLTDAAYDHAARMHATTVALADGMWPTGTATAEQQQALEVAQSIARLMPASQLMRRAGAAPERDRHLHGRRGLRARSAARRRRAGQAGWRAPPRCR